MAETIPYNPLDLEQRRDPYPLLARARREAPVFFSETFNIWVVTRYEDVWTVLRDPVRFSSAISTNVRSEIPDEVATILREGWGEVATLVSCDPPAHTRFRGLINKAFTPRRINEREPRIREIAADLLSRLAARGRADIVWDFAYPLPMTVISEILGVPRDDLDVFKRWSDDLVARLSFDLPLERQKECARSLVEFQKYFSARLDERAEDPRDDMLTAMIDARLEGAAPLARGEMLSILQQILVAGNETTTNLIGSMVALLLEDRSRWEAVCADPGLVPGVVEEALRLEAPVQGLFRMATEDVELGGARIPKGAQLQLHYGAANRDEGEFAAAESFDLRRANAATHLSFGGGPHFCLGAALARLEGRIALTMLCERLPDLRLVPDQPRERAPHFFLRGFEHLWVEWTPRA